MKKILILLSIALFAGSCEKDADIELPKIDPMIGVYGFLAADSSLRIELSDVRSIFEPNNMGLMIDGALVIIRQGANTYTLTGNGNGVYTHSHLVKAGATYELEVQKAGYKTVRATCTMPTYAVPRPELEYLALPDIDSDSIRRFGLRFQDKLGEKNYYRFGVDAHYHNPNLMEAYFTSNNLSDQAKDGQELFSGFGSVYSYGMDEPLSLTAFATISTLNEDLYKYMTSYDAYWFSEDNPFAEPVIMYSNIQNGVGIFGGVIHQHYVFPIY